MSTCGEPHVSTRRLEPFILLFVGFTYICDDGVAIVRCDEILHLAWAGSIEVVSTDKMRCKTVLGRIGAWVAIGGSIRSICCSSGHCVCTDSHTREFKSGKEWEDVFLVIDEQSGNSLPAGKLGLIVVRR